jgi:hypothetical protein
MEQYDNQPLRANNDVYYGLAIFALFFGAFAYIIDTPFIEKTLWGITGLITAGGLVDMIGFQKKKVLLEKNELHIYKGWFNRHTVVDVLTAENIRCIDAEDKEYNLAEMSEVGVKDVKKIIFKINPEKSIELNQYDYNNERFNRFAAFLQQKIKDIRATEQEKLSFSLENCDKLIAQDKLLVKQLTENLQQAYSSVYVQHKIMAEPEEKERIKEQLQADGILYYYTNDHKTYYYFEKNDFLGETDEADQATAQALIETAQKNIQIATQRIQAYRQLQEKMLLVIEQYQHREQLKQVANNLSLLQEKNIEKHQRINELDYDATIFGELQHLMTALQQADTADQAEILRQYIIEFQKTQKK